MDTETLYQTGLDALAAGRIQEASNAFTAVVKEDPHHFEALHQLGVIALRTRQPKIARATMQHALQDHPDRVEAYLVLGAAQTQLGELAAALETFDRGLERTPESGELYAERGRTLQAAGQEEEALASFRRATELMPDWPQGWSMYASLLAHRHALPEARAAFEEALRVDPDYAEAAAGLASVFDRLDEGAKGMETLAPFLRRDDAPVSVAVAFGRIAPDVDAVPDAVSALESCVRRPNLPKRQRAQALFTLAKLRDREGDYDGAFAACDEANGLEPVEERIEAHVRGHDAVRAVVTASLLDQMPTSSERSDAPVFIIGMPRSGTTLTDRIISAHPEGASAGELPTIQRAARVLPAMMGVETGYPACLRDVSAEALDKIAAEFMRQLRHYGGDAERIVDKTPTNYLHVGLISRVFPNARFIHCVRHPLDIAVSCYIQDFAENQPYTRSLTGLGRTYARYVALMKHWTEDVGITMREIAYEDTVSAFEETARAVIDYCDLSWDPACLRFNENQSQVNTLSYDQVRRPLYASSVNRYRNYRRHLQPFIDAGGDSLDGWDLD